MWLQKCNVAVLVSAYIPLAALQMLAFHKIIIQTSVGIAYLYAYKEQQIKLCKLRGNVQHMSSVRRLHDL
jgi:hypothetical protein